MDHCDKGVVVKVEPPDDNLLSPSNIGPSAAQSGYYVTQVPGDDGLLVAGSNGQEKGGYVYTLFQQPLESNRGQVEIPVIRGHSSFDGLLQQQEDLLPSGMKRPKPSNLPKKFKCAMCMYRTRYKSDLNRHVRKHAISTFSCEICNMPFKTAGNVEFHKRKEHPSIVLDSKERSKFACNICSYDTMHSSDLTRHQRKHGVAKYHCGACSKPFMTSGSLVHHKQVAHGTRDLEVVMDLDGQETVQEHREDVTEANSKATINLVNGTAAVEDWTGNVSCDEVHRDTRKDGDGKQEDNLEDSVGSGVLQASTVATESDVSASVTAGTTDENTKSTNTDGTSDRLPQYKCPLCNKVFGRRMALQYHLRNGHVEKGLGDDDWVDNDMDETAADITTKASYSDRRSSMKYQCSRCVYGTMYKATFDRHLKRHEFPCHVCELCQMPFVTIGHLLKHKRDNHPDHEPSASLLRCTDCFFYTESSRILKDHINQHHDVSTGLVQETPDQRVDIKADKEAASYPCYEEPCDLTSHKVECYNGPRRNIMPISSPQRNNKEPRYAGNQLHGPGVVTQVSPRMQSPSYVRPSSAKQSPPPMDNVVSVPPASGRYARLVSDFDDFACRPFACALCFFRTADTAALQKHAENHLTGCNMAPVPEAARFPILYPGSSFNVDTDVPVDLNRNGFAGRNPSDDDAVFKHPTARDSGKARKLSDVVNALHKTAAEVKPKMEYPPVDTARMPSAKAEPITPTFSVHYRKDRTNKNRPYLCLMCRKRFRHLTLLKQHFRLSHTDTSGRVYQCLTCSKTFRDPTTLQLHHDLEHDRN